MPMRLAAHNRGMDEELAERIVRAAELVPPGRVVAYGDLADLVGCGPRHVGNVMRLMGGQVAWWRITNSSGDLPKHLRAEARVHWAREGIAWKPNGLGCRIRDHRADLPALADAYEAATADLPPR